MDEIPDIVKELRDEMTDGWSGDACAVGCDVAERAAVEIERLRAALLAEREAATKAEREACAAVLDDEAGAMLSQRDELLDEGKLGGHLMRPEHIKGLVRERRDLAEGYTRLATAIRSGARP